MILYVLAAILATTLFGVAAVLLKIGVSRGIPDVSLSALRRDGWRMAWTLLSNRVWLGGLALNAIGGIFYFIALARLDLTIVKPVITFYVVVAAVLGAVWLRERVSRAEALGIATAVLGAVLLGIQGEAATGDAVALSEQVRGMYRVLLGALVLTVLLCAPLLSRAFRERVGRELPLSVISGLYWGLGAAWYKLFFNELEALPSVTAAGGLADALAQSAFWVESLTTLSLWLMLALNVFGFAVYQFALASGRVAIITPVVMVATLVAPLVAGVGIFGEDLPALKTLGIAVMCLGTVVLSLGRPAVEPAGPRPAAG